MEQILEVFHANGVMLTEADYSLPLEIDSVQFISILVGIEEKFGIEIPEQYMNREENLNTFNDFVEMVQKQKA